jgi:pyrimidine-specific ribonucleoside hydrolase
MPDVVTRVLFDVDTGIDDALALLYAVAHPELHLAGVTCVSGNVALAQVVRNTCAVLDLAAAADVPVAAGANATLLGAGPRVGHRHGGNGLSDLPIPVPGHEPEPDSAVDLLRRKLGQADVSAALVALAPQTNLALLLRDHLDEMAGSIEKLIFVGGRLVEAVPLEPPEFNLGHDPEAAAIVLGSELPITMYGLDIFNQVVVSQSGIQALCEHDHAAARLAGDLLRVRHGHLIGDAGALVMLTNPDLFTVQRAPIRTGLDSAERGRTIIDAAARATEVVTAVEADQAAKAFVDTIAAGFR